MSKSQIEQLVEGEEGMRLFQQERVILSATERICEAMEEKGINRKSLADALGTSKSFVTQLLDGTRNMTLRTLSDVFLVLGYAVDIYAEPVEESVRSPNEMVVDLEVPSWSETNQEPWETNGSELECHYGLHSIPTEDIAA